MVYDPSDVIEYSDMAKELFDLFNQYMFDLIETDHFYIPPRDTYSFDYDEDEDTEIKKMFERKRKAFFNTALEAAVRDLQDKYDLSESDLEMVLSMFEGMLDCI